MGKPGSKPVSFDKHEKAMLVDTLQRYFSRELQQEIGRFDAEFLLDFISGNIGVHYYNRGIRDAQAALAGTFDDLHDALYQLEQPTEVLR
ncbi:DUF2164 domain-containing protein [Stenotrophomonas sp. YIM B06876]|uniref:DUF2164 domain-containing protein n=1 Tax=Stenotrophomonas sp. YIM B06876 TaxID=3060211 RepID=UPI002739285D|nr:DUF2164 domain-containing protein [Stenotrophomonas sp. YIM B06876]